MFPKSLTIVVCGLLMLASTRVCNAAIGESKAEIQKRYGKPTESRTQKELSKHWGKYLDGFDAFQKPDVLITVFYIKGVCVIEALKFKKPQGMNKVQEILDQYSKDRWSLYGGLWFTNLPATVGETLNFTPDNLCAQILDDDKMNIGFAEALTAVIVEFADEQGAKRK